MTAFGADCRRSEVGVATRVAELAFIGPAVPMLLRALCPDLAAIHVIAIDELARVFSSR